MYLAKLKVARDLNQAWKAHYSDAPPRMDPPPPTMDPPPADPPPVDPTGAVKPPVDPKDPKDKDPASFTQDHVNRLLAEQKRKSNTATESVRTELAAQIEKLNLTQESRDALEEQVNSLRRSTMTKEQISKEEAEKSRQTHEQEVSKLTGERDQWKEQFHKSTILRDITDAAVANDAYSPSQMVAILHSNTRLVEVIDETTKKPTGDFRTEVDLLSKNEDGSDVTLTLTPIEAVKKMREMTDFMNLFKGNTIGGLGEGNTGVGESSINIAKLAKENPEEYRRLRASGEITL